MEITIYTQPTCKPCAIMKALLRRSTADVKEIVVGENISVLDFANEFPTISSTPLVIIDGVYYMGLPDVAKKLLSEGLIIQK
jgi:glutaredoxin